ncbi:MAG: hypothetical protein V2B18_02080 [Pseudomonadota bacterium]
MGHIPGFKAAVRRNGEEIDFLSASVKRNAAEVAASWTITLPYPINLDPEDLWTIERGMAGHMEVLVEEATATGMGGEDGTGRAVRVVTGKGVTSDILSYCVPKTLVFVNPSWLNTAAAGACLRDGIVKLVYGNYEQRFYHPRLPGKDTGDAEFECLVGPSSHHAIARHLAGLVGWKLVVNTPDVQLYDTRTIAAGTTWFEAITADFRMWMPTVRAVNGTIFILDVLSEDPEDVAAGRGMKLSNAAVVSIGASESAYRDGDPIDHLIITGRPISNAVVTFPKPIDMVPITIPEIPLVENEVHTYPEEFTGLYSRRVFGEYLGPFNEGDNPFTSYLPKARFHTDAYYIQSGKRTLVRKVIETLGPGGGLVDRITTEYKYGPGRKPIGSVETHEAMVRLPGSGGAETFEKILVRTTRQDQFLEAFNQVLASEVIEGLVVYDSGNGSQHFDPVPLDDVWRADKSRAFIDPDPDTTQRTLHTTLHVRSTHVNRVDDMTLVLFILDQDVLTGHTRVKSQFLENPIKDVRRIERETPFRREYHQAPGGSESPGRLIGTIGRCYRKPFHIRHDDLTQDNVELMDRIAAGVFARKGGRTLTLTVKTPVPIPFQEMLQMVEVPEMTYRVKGSAVIVPGGDYYLVGVEERFGYRAGSGNSARLYYEQLLTLRGIGRSA